jgi:diguanylate cyclase (GGDEF)-like protein
MRETLRKGAIVVTTISPIYLSFFVFKDISNDFLLSLLIIPSYLIIVMTSNWTTASIPITGFIFIQAILQFFRFDAGEASKERLIQLICDPLVNLSILIVITHYRIKSVRAIQKLFELSILDPLTGIYNRRHFSVCLDRTVSLAKQLRMPLLLVTLDIDDFKRINDTYGHPCGDEVLRDLTRRISKAIRGSDIFVRIGGEEFSILMPDTDLGKGMEIAERLRILVQEKEFEYNGNKIPITISLGLAQYGGETVAQMIEKADKALYEAKANGRNQFVVADREVTVN